MYFSWWLAFIYKSHDFLAQMQSYSSEAYRSHCKNNMAVRSKSFQTFSSDLLSKSFQNFSSDLLSKIFQQFAFKILQLFSFQKAFKNLPAICFQNFSSDYLSNFFHRFAFKFLNAPRWRKFESSLLSKICKRKLDNEFSFSSFWKQLC